MDTKYLTYLSPAERELLQRGRESEAMKILAERKGLSANMASNMMRRAKHEMEKIGQEHEVHLIGANQYYMCLGEGLCCFCKSVKSLGLTKSEANYLSIKSELQDVIKKRKKGAFWS